VEGDEHGPAVMLSTADSIFPAILADAWRKRGLEVVVVTCGERGNWLPPDVRVIRSGESSGPWSRWAWRAASRLLSPVERILARLGRRRFRRNTGRDAPEAWEWQVLQPSLASGPLARTVLAQRPRFVFGQEAAAYGLATARCRGVPRILFPWGSDVFNTAESWPGAHWMIRRALHGVDLVVPSSTTAARHLIRRFGLPEAKVKALSWGIDLAGPSRASAAERSRLCAKWGLDPAAVIVQNCRRFLPLWGCFTALDAFLRLSEEVERAHFVLFGGEAARPHLAEARRRIAAAGKAARFTLVDRELKFEEFLELASVSDIFTSLVQRGDMRSSSVLLLAAAGAAPVIGDVPEYRLMAENGFSALFPSATSADQALDALRRLLGDPALRTEFAARNAEYLRIHEDRERQLDLLLSLIDEVCQRYYGGDKGGKPGAAAANVPPSDDVDEA
jgi:glycosyltransferase involved in cell wall biosynthesis